MTEGTDPATFEKIVEFAYNSLPQKVKDLPDFPGIQVVDEPPKEMFEEMAKRRRWNRGTELLGCYSGVSRTERQFNQIRVPDLIFVFRGPILRCSKGNLSAEVKQVVWHEVAHWLGHAEKEVKELGLSLSFKDLAPDPIANEKAETLRSVTVISAAEETQIPPRCVKCYSTEVAWQETNKPISSFGAWLSDPLLVHTKAWTCSACGHIWEDEEAE
jgi:predicted Zn-dependent protease with MMP-like domain